MKLRVEPKTGHTSPLKSWKGTMVPKVGDFTSGMDPNHTDRLVILWHGNNYWTSKALNKNHINRSNWLNTFHYVFSYVSNGNETSFNYSVNKDSTATTRLTIDY